MEGGGEESESVGERGALSSAFKFQIILLLLAKIIEILVRKHFFTCCCCFLVAVVDVFVVVVVVFSACKSLIINFLINFYTAGKLLHRVSMRQVFRLRINVIFILFMFFLPALYFHFYFHIFFALLLCVCVCMSRRVTPPRAVCLTGASKFDEFLNLKSLFVHF